MDMAILMTIKNPKIMLVAASIKRIPYASNWNPRKAEERD